MNPKIDAYFSRIENWQEELETLRAFILDCGLMEVLKMGRSVLCVSKRERHFVGRL
jgi:uncharacterized protein YdeI (YjbR/CyaY-like superfamily)